MALRIASAVGIVIIALNASAWSRALDFGKTEFLSKCAECHCADGGEAERLISAPDDSNAGDRLDIAYVRELLHRRYRSERQVEVQFRRLQLAARRLVTSSRHQIERVAHALLQRGTLSSDEVIEVFGSSSAPSWVR